MAEEIESIVKVDIKEEKELVIESDWLPNKLEDEENEYYQEFVKENMLSEDTTENLDESDASEDDYEESDEHDYGENDDYIVEIDFADAVDREDALESTPLYQLQLNKWILDNFIGRECLICNEKLPNYSALQRHIILKHKESMEQSESNYDFSSYNCAICKICNQQFFTQYSRYVHTKEHSELTSKSDIYNCNMCNFSSKRMHVQKHILRNHPEVVQEFQPSNSIKNMKCPLCSYTYIKRLHLSYHFMDKHPKEYNAKIIYNCPLCGDDHFDEKEQFLQHLIQQHYLNSWKVLNYRKVFEHKDYFACVKCNRLFFQNDKGKLLSHFLNHDAKFIWSCKFCYKKFNFKTSSFSHMCFKMIRYYKVRNETAEVSRKRESKIKNLQKFEECIAHICPFCNKQFNKMREWQHHMRTDHEIDSLKGRQLKLVDNDSNKLSCHVCYAMVPNLTQHINAHIFQHLPYTPYKCLLCLKMLITFEMAIDHVLKQCIDDDSDHDIRLVLKMECPICNFQHNYLTSVLKHYENEHNYFEDFFTAESDNSTMICKICRNKYVRNEKKSCFLHLQNHFDEKTFKCKLCLQSYPTLKRISEHLLQSHNYKPLNNQSIEMEPPKTLDLLNLKNDNFKNSRELTKFVSYVCPECNEYMPTLLSWETHISTHHNFFDESNLHIKEADGSLKCPTCSITVSKHKFQQRKHKLDHMSHKPFVCNLCHERYIDLGRTYVHIRQKHFAPGLFKCHICPVILRTEYQRIEHLKETHPCEEWPDCLCLICYTILESKLCLSIHMEYHNAGRICYTDEVSGTKMLELRDLNALVDRHKKTDENKINVTYDFALASTFNSNHSNDTNNIEVLVEPETAPKNQIKKFNKRNDEFKEYVSYNCPECNEDMTTKELWYSHIRTQHTFFDKSSLYIKQSDGSLKCPTCSIAVRRKPYDQQTHKLCHMPYKSFACKLCNHRYTSINTLYAHIRRRHFAKGTFECPICSENLQTEYQKIEHMKEIHPLKEWPNKMCLICYKMFTKNRTLRDHNMTIHNRDTFRHICYICGSKVFTLREFNSHMDRHKIDNEVKEKLGDDISSQSTSKSSQLNDTNDIAVDPKFEIEHINNRKEEFEEFLSCEIEEKIVDDLSPLCSSPANGQPIDTTNHIEILDESDSENDFEEFISVETIEKNVDITLHKHKIGEEIKENLHNDITFRSASKNSKLNDTEFDSKYETEHINNTKELEKFTSCKIKDISPQCSSANDRSKDITNPIEILDESDTEDDFEEFISCETKEKIIDDITLQCGYANIPSNNANATENVDKRKFLNVRYELNEFINYACPECDADMATLEHWHIHIKTQHNFFDDSNLYIKEADGSVKCPTCRITVHSGSYPQERHQLVHMPYKSFICNLCYERCNSLSSIYNHLLWKHFPQAKFECPICCKVLQTMHEKTKHLNTIHPRKEWPEKMCPICYRMYSAKSSLKQHMVTHNEDRVKYAAGFKIQKENHKIRGEIDGQMGDAIPSQLTFENGQSNGTEIDIIPESENLNKRKSITKSSETKKKKIYEE